MGPYSETCRNLRHSTYVHKLLQKAVCTNLLQCCQISLSFQYDNFLNMADINIEMEMQLLRENNMY
jgi:hypothetical protein